MSISNKEREEFNMKKNNSEEIINRLKKIDLALIMILIITMLIGISAQASTVDNHTSVYNTCMIITNTNYDENIVTCETSMGYIFQFYGIEDYFVGDIIICTMDDNGTPKSIIDDKIIDTKYSGFSMDESPC